MLFTALTLAAATAAAPPPTYNIQIQPAASAACPAVGAIMASNPAIAPSIQRPYAGDDAGGLDYLTKMPPIALMAAVVRTVNGCNAPIIQATWFDGKLVDAPRIVVVPPTKP